MTSVSGKYTTGSAGMGTGNAQAQPALWSYAVPEDEATSGSAPNDYNSSDYSSNPPLRQPLSSHVNGTQRPEARRKNKSIQSLDAEYNASAGLRPPPQINEHSDLSGTTSEADSLLDLYKPSREQWKSSSARGRNNVKRKGSLGAVSNLNEANQQDKDSKWIHRDKLAQIESREMLEMGIPGHRQTSRSRSHAGVKSSKAPSVDADGEFRDEQQSVLDAKRQRTISPTFSNEEADLQDPNHALGYDQSDESASKSLNASHRRRPSASKIPVTKTTAPSEPSSPSSPTDRETRARSGSQTSQTLRQGANATSPTSPPGSLRGLPGQASSSPYASTPQSPQKSKLPGKKTPQSATRGGARGGRTASGQARPGTANGTSSRPSTSTGPRAPEGDPPWMSSMFKPDPMLPPDQQMLPTLAKRLAQEQGIIPPDSMMYETAPPENSEFVLLDNDEPENGDPITPKEQQRELQQQEQSVPQQESNSPRSFHYPDTNAGGSFKTRQVASAQHYEGGPYPSSTENQKSEDQQGNEWPLRSPRDQETFQAPSSPNGDSGSIAQRNGRAGTPGVDSGYSLMPTIQTPKEMEQRLSQRSALSNSNTSGNANSAVQPIRLPDDPEPTEGEKKKKGCAACCIVM